MTLQQICEWWIRKLFLEHFHWTALVICYMALLFIAVMLICDWARWEDEE